MAPLQGTPAPTSTAVSYSAYPSPYGAPVPAGAAPTVAASDPYAQTAIAHPQGAVQVAAPAVAPPAGQPGSVPGKSVSSFIVKQVMLRALLVACIMLKVIVY